MPVRDLAVGRRDAELVALVRADRGPSHGYLVTRSKDVVASEGEVREHCMVETDDLNNSCKAGSLPGLRVVVDDVNRPDSVGGLLVRRPPGWRPWS
jgi:hypothetical protein